MKLTSTLRLHQYREMLESRADELVVALSAVADSASTAPVNLTQWISFFGLDVAGSLGFSVGHLTSNKPVDRLTRSCLHQGVFSTVKDGRDKDNAWSTILGFVQFFRITAHMPW